MFNPAETEPFPSIYLIKNPSKLDLKNLEVNCMEIEACNQWEKLIWPQKKQIKRGRISTFDITVNLLMSSLERVSGKKPEKAVKDLRSVPKKSEIPGGRLSKIYGQDQRRCVHARNRCFQVLLSAESRSFPFIGTESIFEA